MALGKFTSRNLAEAATFSGGVWLDGPGLGLANLKDSITYVAAPARCADIGDLASSQFEADLGVARSINLVALLFHNLSLAAKYRVTLRSPTGTFAAPALQTDWLPVYGRLFPSASLPWESSNWWLGGAAAEDVGLYPPHKFIELPATTAIGVRVELDDQLNPHGFIDVGGAWISGTWSPAINFDRGRTVGITPRGIVEETPAGRFIVEKRQARRQLTVNWSNLTTDEAYRLFDAGMAASNGETVILVPDIEDEASLIREAFPATFQQPPAPRFNYAHTNAVAGVFKEIIA